MTHPQNLWEAMLVLKIIINFEVRMMGSLTTSVTSHGIKWGMINYPGVNIIFLSVHNI
jgi:hypothetical protein